MTFDLYGHLFDDIERDRAPTWRPSRRQFALRDRTRHERNMLPIGQWNHGGFIKRWSGV
jgi:hypothetical protein